MKCPMCQCDNDIVIPHSRKEMRGGDVVRRRKCQSCGYVFNTREKYAKRGVWR